MNIKVKIILIFVIVLFTFITYFKFNILKKNNNENEIKQDLQQGSEQESENIIEKEEPEKLSQEDCPEFYVPDEATNFSTCREITTSKKQDLCKSKDMLFYNNSCKKVLTEEDCPEFYIPDKLTNKTSCIELSDEGKKELCKSKGENVIYYNNKCQNVLTKDDCKKKTNKDDFYPLVPNEDTQNTTCRNMNNTEKEEFCISKDMFWSGKSCLQKLKKPIITIMETKPLEVTLKVNITDYNLSLITIKYLLEEKEIVGEISEINDSEKFVLLKIDNLIDNTNYSVKIKYETNINKYESPYSDIVNFKTPCNTLLYTDLTCKKTFGPKGKVDSTVTEEFKDKTTKSWPFFKIPDTEKCMCREMTENEKIDYCINNFYSSFKTSGRKVEIVGDKCVPQIITLDAPISTQLVTPLNINQTIDGDITDVKKYRIDYPYRLLLSWSRPDLNITGRGLEAAPSSYNIYREIDGNFELIHNLKVTKDQTEMKWVDGDNLNFPKQKYQTKLEASSKYTYKITSVNTAGEGKPIIGSGITIEKLITNKECNNILDDPDDKINFKGFHQVINYDNNSCAPMPYDQRQLTCESLDMIQEPYPNYYIETELEDGKKIKTCAPLVKDLKVPDKPSISLESKTENNISLKITPPENKGIPMLTHYYIIWENIITGEKGRLEDVENKGLLGIKILETNKYITNHINLQPGTTYKYTITAISVNDKIWRYKSNNMVDGRPVGMSDSNSISVTTDYTVPTKLPSLKLLNESLEKLEFVINKFPEGFEGGAIKGDNKAIIIKYKIVKNIFPTESDLNASKKSLDLKKEYVVELNNINTFNTDNASFIQISYNSDSKEYIVIDYDNQPQTKYNYTLYAMNNKINEWTEINNSIIMKTPTLSPLYECDNITKLKYNDILSVQNRNKKMINLIWDMSVDPNIERYKQFKNIYQPTKTTYTITIIDKSNNTTINTLQVENDTTINIDNITPGKEYKVVFNIEHKGSLKLTNGYEDFVSCTNPSPKKHKIDVKELTQEDCKNTIYSDTTSITDNNVFMDLDKSNKPYRCVKKSNASLTQWCKDNKGNNHIYWGEDKKCVIPEDGKWDIILDNSNGPCTIDGNAGDDIRCGGGKKIIKQWRYTEPKYGAKDVAKPEGSTISSNNSNIANIIVNCNTDNCRELCENSYYGKFKTTKAVLTQQEFDSNEFCDTDATIPSKFESEKNILNDCPSCGDPSIERNVEDICTDGLYGQPSVIDCMQRTDIGNIDDWKYIKNVSIDSSKKVVKQYSRKRSNKCKNLNWCVWKEGKWSECDKYCGPGKQTRTVTCDPINGCNPDIKPATNQPCNRGNCKTMCEKQYKKYHNNKESLTEAEFKNEANCETKLTLKPIYTDDNDNMKEQKCPSCGNPSNKYKRTLTCTDGLYGPDKDIKCKKVYSTIGWKPNGNTTRDGQTVDVFKWESVESCGNNWCEWKSGSWSGCNNVCGTSYKSRDITCPLNGGCQDSKRPTDKEYCDVPSCSSKCRGLYRKWKGGKNSLSNSEFNGNTYCETKNTIHASMSTTDSSCKSCDNPNTTFTRTKRCTNGLYGPDSMTKCKQKFKGITWYSNGTTTVDGTSVDTFINRSYPKCSTKGVSWCGWKTGGWSNCSPSCGKSCNDTRNVSCKGPGSCNPSDKPGSSRNRNGGTCWNPGNW